MILFIKGDMGRRPAVGISTDIPIVQKDSDGFMNRWRLKMYSLELFAHVRRPLRLR